VIYERLEGAHFLSSLTGPGWLGYFQKHEGALSSHKWPNLLSKASNTPDCIAPGRIKRRAIFLM
jgi:hypothetical protein